MMKFYQNLCFASLLVMVVSVAMAHGNHRAVPDTGAGIQRSEAQYVLPAANVVRHDASRVSFSSEIDDGRPVLLNFVYTSCTAICPVSTQVFSQVQEMLGKDRSKVHMVSISIDPEHDTPSRLAAYAKKFDASAQWQFYSGSIGTTIAIQKAFDAYRGDKMNHIPVTFVRSALGKPWVRLDGFASPADVLRELQSLK